MSVPVFECDGFRRKGMAMVTPLKGEPTLCTIFEIIPVTDLIELTEDPVQRRAIEAAREAAGVDLAMVLGRSVSYGPDEPPGRKLDLVFVAWRGKSGWFGNDQIPIGIEPVAEGGSG